MRDLIVFGVVFGLLPFCFLRPWVGVLVFCWLSYMNPHRFTWGPAYDFPFAQIVAMATLAGFMLTREKDRFYMEREFVLVILLWVVFTLTSFSAFYPENAWEMWKKTSKIFLIALITVPLFIDRVKLKWLLLITALSLGMLGVKGGIFTILSGGAHNVKGPPGSFMTGEGDFGLALNMTVPILYYLARSEENLKLKFVLNSALVFSVISIIFTYRRGAFLGLAAVGLLLLLKSRRKILAVPLIALGVLAAPFLVTEKWTERMGTIGSYEEDGSAMGRINAWKTAWNVVQARPLQGAGFEGLSGETIYRYSPDPAATAGDVHSIYFEVLGEHGFVGFALFAALLLSALLSLRKLKKDSRGDPARKWIVDYSDMLQVSIIAYMVCGIFLGRAYFDLFYNVIMIVVILKVLARKEMAKASAPSPGALPALEAAPARAGAAQKAV